MNEDREVTERQSQIEKKSALITETIQALGQSVKELEKRLEIVLTANNTVEGRGEDTEKVPMNSPLAGRLLDYDRQLQEIRSSVTDILGRLDL